jgi:putative ABC transport system ATP-binding protein
MNVLSAEKLSKSYGRGDRRFDALRAASFSVAKGELAVITGASGSGKSTLLNIVAGLLPPDSGTVALGGVELTLLGDDGLSRLRSGKIGYVPQGQSALECLTAIDNVCLPHYLAKRRGDPAPRAMELLGSMGIAHLAGRYPSELSGGELRRVSIARGLINSPLLLVSDEPTGELDPENAAAVMRIFAEAARDGAAALVVTHETASLGGLPCRRFEMSEGRLRELRAGPPQNQQ